MLIFFIKNQIPQCDDLKPPQRALYTGLDYYNSFNLKKSNVGNKVKLLCIVQHNLFKYFDYYKCHITSLFWNLTIILKYTSHLHIISSLILFFQLILSFIIAHKFKFMTGFCLVIIILISLINWCYSEIKSVLIYFCSFLMIIQKIYKYY